VVPLFRPYVEQPIHVGFASIRLLQDYDVKNFRGFLRQASILALLCASLTAFASTAFAQEGTFIPTGSLNTARGNHTATLLNNGMVLIAGGITRLTSWPPCGTNAVFRTNGKNGH
jgi:hypothetical protein